MDRSDRAQQLEDALKLRISQRNTTYQHISAFSIRFEDDDTGAATDANNFKGLVATFGVRSVDECVIQPTDRTPGWTVNGRLGSHFTSGFASCSPTAPGRLLVVLFYTGHGANDSRHGLWFKANRKSKSSMRFDFLCESLLDLSQGASKPVDIVFIINCCSAGAATLREYPTTGTFEVLAAVSEDNTAFSSSDSKITHRTFTAKLAAAAAEARGKAKSVDFAELLERSYKLSQVKYPLHKFLNGSVSVRLKFPTREEDMPAPTSHQLPPALSHGEYRVIFTCHVTEDPDSLAMTKLLEWIDSLDDTIGIKVDSVYEVDSTLLILVAPYSVFCTLQVLVGAQLLRGHGRLVQRKPSSSKEPTSEVPNVPVLPPASETQENSPPKEPMSEVTNIPATSKMPTRPVPPPADKNEENQPPIH
ncbi:hypothetical protein MferCBS31731_007380 [Microsporum ferrugineum]